MFKAIRAYLNIRRQISITMNLTELKTCLAAECKKRTAAYFDGLKPIITKDTTNRAVAAAKAIADGNFGCSTPSVVALVSAILEEDLAPLVTPLHRPQPPIGTMISFLSERMDPGKWLPSLSISLAGQGANYIINKEPNRVHTLNEKSLDKARSPTTDEIVDFFANVSLEDLQKILGSTFGMDALTA